MRFLFVSAVVLLFAGSAAAEEKKPAEKTVEVTVTEKGFEPKEIRAKVGELLTLIITRKVEETCATEVVLDEYNIKQTLPLNQAVKVSFTPKKTGKLKYGCAMNKMIGARIVIE
jgi:plastocyanin domain-containing protein